MLQTLLRPARSLQPIFRPLARAPLREHSTQPLQTSLARRRSWATRSSPQQPPPTSRSPMSRGVSSKHSAAGRWSQPSPVLTTQRSHKLIRHIPSPPPPSVLQRQLLPVPSSTQPGWQWVPQLSAHSPPPLRSSSPRSLTVHSRLTQPVRSIPSPPRPGASPPQPSSVIPTPSLAPTSFHPPRLVATRSSLTPPRPTSLPP